MTACETILLMGMVVFPSACCAPNRSRFAAAATTRVQRSLQQSHNNRNGALPDHGLTVQIEAPDSRHGASFMPRPGGCGGVRSATLRVLCKETSRVCQNSESCTPKTQSRAAEPPSRRPLGFIDRPYLF